MNSAKMNLNQRNSIWEEQEEQFLLFLRDDLKIKKWTIISEKLTERFPGISKCSRQCRERYENYSRFGVSEQPEKFMWTPQIENRFVELFLKYGSRWKSISGQINNFLVGKYVSQITLKNKFYNSLRKFSNQINFLTKGRPNRIKIKFQSLQRLLSLMIFSNGELYGQLSYKVLDYSQHYDKIITEEDADYISQGIYQFNKEVRMPINRILQREMDQITTKLEEKTIIKQQFNNHWPDMKLKIVQENQ